MTPEQELWGVAVWVEKYHGADGPRFIAEQIGRLVLQGESEGVKMWKAVAARYQALSNRSDSLPA